MSNLFPEIVVELSNLRGKFALSTKFDSWFTYCVLSRQKSVSVEFELFDLEYFPFGSQKLHLAVTSILGSLLWFHLSLSCRRSFLGQNTAKLSYLCKSKSCRGAKIALNSPYNTTSGSVFADRIEQVKKTKFEIGLIKIVVCFLDGHVN